MAKRWGRVLPNTDEEEAEIRRGIAADPDNQELTDEELTGPWTPFKDAFPELLAEIKQQEASRGRPKLERPKEKVTLRLSGELMDYYRGSGPGWQTRLNRDLTQLLRKRRALMTIDGVGIKKPRQPKVA